MTPAKNVLTIITIVAINSMLLLATYSDAEAQAQQVFESSQNGVRFQVPAGYVVEDNPPMDSYTEDMFLLGGLNIPDFPISVCPAENALPAIGGTHTCQESEGPGQREGGGKFTSAQEIQIMRVFGLQEREEFATVVSQNKEITPDDLLAFFITSIMPFGGVGTDIQILKTTNATVGYYDTANSTTPTTLLPARQTDIFYETKYRTEIGTTTTKETRGFYLYVLTPDKNTGYIIAYEEPASEAAQSGNQTWITPEIGTVIIRLSWWGRAFSK